MFQAISVDFMYLSQDKKVINYEVYIPEYNIHAVIISMKLYKFKCFYKGKDSVSSQIIENIQRLTGGIVEGGCIDSKKLFQNVPKIPVEMGESVDW